MRRLYTLAVALLVGAAAYAQSYSDDFETYTVGNFLSSESSEWGTWSGGSGGADDVTIVDDNSNSGDNSIYLYATSSNGGPDDIVLPFGDKYTSGEFSFSMMMFVENSNGAYFNFQGEETIGQIWTLECAMNQDGGITISNTNGQLLTASYTTGQWIEVAFEINLNQNQWEFFIDGNSQGTFSNTINYLAGLNIFAYNGTNGGNGASSFWVDDVSYEHTAGSLPDRNGAVTAISPINGLVGQTKKPVVTVRNLGVQDITSFDIDVDYNGETVTKSVTGENMASYDELQITVDEGIELVEGNNTLTATISNVNGAGTDDDTSDDDASIAIDPLVPGMHKMVVIEEATGTWCGWCPRGTVWMAYMQENYPDHFIGLAVHNGDPMVYEEWDDGIGTLISGYPSCVVDRGSDIDPSVMEPDFLNRVVLDPSVTFCMSGEMNEDETMLTVSVEVTAMMDFDNDWRIAAAIAENGVTGSSSQYAQANYYSGGGSGTLSGAGKDWHLEPNPVPASEMVYDHVARIILPSFNGMEDAFPDGGTEGETYDFTFEIPVSSSWNMDEVHVITMVYNGNGKIDNGYQMSYADAVAADCTEETTGLDDRIVKADPVQVYPNPAVNHVTINAVLNDASNNQLIVRDMMGRVVFQHRWRDAQGWLQINLDLNEVPSGVYLVEAISGSSSNTTKFIKE